MQSKLYLFVFACCLTITTILPHASQAQCTSRYLDTIFTSVDTFANIAYTDSAGGSAATELMDIYQPTGDSACQRHLIIWLHGGAFVSGNKNDGDMEFLSKRFAQRGYVCASLNYRLASSIVLLYDSVQIFKYAIEAMSDLKAAVRYFYKDAAQTNHWNIDTNSIFIGGSSAGGIACDFAATLDSVSEATAVFQPEFTSMGGIEGNSGNAGYSTKVIGVASLAGAVNSLAWIKPSTTPIVMCQGTADGTIPYYYGQALAQYTFGLIPTIIDFAGSGVMSPRLDSVGVQNSLLPFPGSGHVPWDTNVVIENRMDSAVAAFFYAVKCAQAAGHCSSPQKTTGINNPESSNKLSIYPNPANDLVQISVNGLTGLSEITVYDYTGREISQQAYSGQNVSISVKGLPPGVYLLRLDMNDASIILRKILVE